MIISINKAPEEYDGSTYTRPSPNEYQFEFKYKENSFNCNIDISESKKQSTPERSFSISTFIDEDYKSNLKNISLFKFCNQRFKHFSLSRYY